jgi:heme-degrading monooxygenase HmoA
LTAAINHFIYARLYESSADTSHKLQKNIETESRYLLLVNWQTLEEHTISFRESAGYQQWNALLHRFYEPFPEV